MVTYKTSRKDNKKKICSVRVGRFRGEEPARNSMVTLLKVSGLHVVVTVTGKGYERTA